MKSQEQELELAVLDKGEYQLRPEFLHLVVTGDKWAKMTNDQGKEALSRVHHIGLQEDSPISVASVNEKLVEGESAVFQNQSPRSRISSSCILTGKYSVRTAKGTPRPICAHAVAASLKRGTLEAYLKWLVANKRKTGGLNYSKAITFGMPVGRGRKGGRQPRGRRGKQTTSMVVPRNPLPSTPSIGANECENYPDVPQLHEFFPASCQPGVATHQAQLSPLYPAVYNPPGFPFHGRRFHHPHASTFQAHTPQARFQAAPPHRSLSIPPGPLAAAGAWHSGLSPHSYYLVALPKNVKKCYGCGDNFSEKFPTVGWCAQHRLCQHLSPS